MLKISIITYKMVEGFGQPSSTDIDIQSYPCVFKVTPQEGNFERCDFSPVTANF